MVTRTTNATAEMAVAKVAYDLGRPVTIGDIVIGTARAGISADAAEKAFDAWVRKGGFRETGERGARVYVMDEQLKRDVQQFYS